MKCEEMSFELRSVSQRAAGIAPNYEAFGVYRTAHPEKIGVFHSS
jgi:hypothetical protein